VFKQNGFERIRKNRLSVAMIFRRSKESIWASRLILIEDPQGFRSGATDRSPHFLISPEFGWESLDTVVISFAAKRLRKTMVSSG
jgi:hypothetical protein